MLDEFLEHSALLDKLLLEFVLQEQYLKEIQNLKDKKDLGGLDIHPDGC